MKMNRRSVLIGLGAAGIGTGAIFGSGAFTNVEADREATFEVTNDGSALLGLSGDGQYVEETDSGTAGEDIIEFNFSDLNDDAKSTFEGVLTVTNNTQDEEEKNIYIDDDGTVEEGGVVDFEDGGSSVVGSGNAVTVADSTSVELDIIIDTNEGDPGDVDTITVVGEET